MDKQIHHTYMLSLLQKYVENRCSEEELYALLYELKSPEILHEFNTVSESLWNRIDSKNLYADERQTAKLNEEVDILLQRIKQKNVPLPKKKPVSGRLKFYRVAALILVLIGLGVSYLLSDKFGSEELVYTEISVPRGETKEYKLDDGTRIVLNSGSKLVVPSDFNKGSRCVEMLGEGFFDVTPNPEKPFVIKSEGAQVRVVGTSFNVKAYPEDEYLGVTVSTGKVLVNLSDLDLQLRVTPMEHLTINKKTGNLTKLPLKENNYIKWMDGALHFDKEPIREVIKMINRKYNRNVLLRCKDCDRLISGTHDNKSLEAVIEAICFTTGLQHKEEGDSIILYE